MVVAIDIGNTDVVIGFCEEERWNHIFRISSQLGLHASDYEQRLRVFLLEASVPTNLVTQVVMSSVVPDLIPVLSEVVHQLFSKEIILIDGDLISSLSLNVKNPYELGSDLAANAVGAYAKYQSSVIIVDFGTALTFTSVSNDGEILGVAIAPGVKTAMQSLSLNTARLPEIPLEIPGKVIGGDTTHALQAGIMQGYVGLIQHIITMTKTEMNENPKVIATGGLSFAFESLTDTFDDFDPQLTLNGLLAILAQVN